MPTKPPYALEGPKWPKGPITWSIDQPGPGLPFTSPVNAAERSIVMTAIAKWHVATGLSFLQVTDRQAQPADIRIGFVALASGNEIGLTLWHASAGTFLPGTLVELQDPRSVALTGTGAKLAYAGTPTSLYQVALHELGHALGLAHTSDTLAIMYPTLGYANQTLDNTDIAGIHALYTGSGGTSPAAGLSAAHFEAPRSFGEASGPHLGSSCIAHS